MFCPGCGQQPASDRIRYCTSCGFALNKLTDFLSDEVPTNTRQFDITLGAGLMLVGTIKAILLTLAIGGPHWDGATTGLFLLAAFYGVLQMFFQLSPRQKGLSLGATLLFLTSLVALPASYLGDGFGALLVGVVALPLILFWSRLAQAFTKLFFEKKEAGDHTRSLPARSVAVLQPSPNHIQAEVETQRMKSAAIAQPASVTESTTGLLEKP
jgi:hypothetical protein